MSKDFIPRPDAAFEDFFKFITDYVIDNASLAQQYGAGRAVERNCSVIQWHE
jgi:hypothetical protein